jgi:hypothetical protein
MQKVSGREHVQMGTIPIATYPMQIIGVDLLGFSFPGITGTVLF